MARHCSLQVWKISFCVRPLGSPDFNYRVRRSE